MSIKGQGHSLTLAQGHSDSKIKTCFSEKMLSYLKPNFKGKLLGTWKCNFIQFILVTWWRWLPCPYMYKVKTIFEISPSVEPAVDCFETWYLAYATWAYHSLFKWWPWVDLDLFTPRSNFVAHTSVWKKGKSWIFQKQLQSVISKLIDAVK